MVFLTVRWAYTWAETWIEVGCEFGSLIVDLLHFEVDRIALVFSLQVDVRCVTAHLTHLGPDLQQRWACPNDWQGWHCPIFVLMLVDFIFTRIQDISSSSKMSSTLFVLIMMRRKSFLSLLWCIRRSNQFWNLGLQGFFDGFDENLWRDVSNYHFERFFFFRLMEA